MTTASWMADQLQRAADGRRAMPLEVARYNPRPAGVIREGSASHTTLAALQARPGQWLTHAQILHITGLGTKAACWALIYLTAQGHIESTPDDSRNARYRRYRAAKPQGGAR